MTTAARDEVRVTERPVLEPFGSSLEQLLTGLAYIDLRVRWAVARARAHGLDPEDEFRGLYISESQVDTLLGYDIGDNLWTKPNGHLAGLEEWPAVLEQARAQWQARSLPGNSQSGSPLLLSGLIDRFHLSQQEVDVLLVALAPEIDPRYERLFAYLQDDVTKKRPSIDLTLNLLTDSFAEKIKMRALFAEQGSLIASRLVVLFADGASREPTLLNHYLRPAGRVVEHLLGTPGVDEKLSHSASLYLPEALDPAAWLPSDIISRLEAAATRLDLYEQRPMFAFQGGYGVGKQAAAQYLAKKLNQPLLVLDLSLLQQSETDLIEGIVLILRDARLLDAVLYLSNWDTTLDDGRPASKIFDLLLSFRGIVIAAGEQVWQPAGQERRRRVLRLPFMTSDFQHRLETWQHYLEVKDLPLNQLANQFQFTPGQIEDVVATAQDYAQWREDNLTEEDLFAASRAHSNQKLTTLATKITPRYRWEDIVLPDDTLLQIREMVNTVRRRPVVYGQWGFDQKIALGKGLNALFAGESGTGKTMAADIIAGELGQDLYKIDLSMLVSKYIGETEKNLNRVFTEASTSNAILFFDEADAIFGKRSEVKDSHDRYANIEISYLLQRMEAYDGVVILATNLRANLDEAFTRRLHFIVEFPFPEAADREVIWRVNFPRETPVDSRVDFKMLARRFRIAGGNIRNIIMAAAFLAAEDGQQVGMVHLLHAARREYQKIGRLIDEQLFVWDPE